LISDHQDPLTQGIVMKKVVHSILIITTIAVTSGTIHTEEVFAQTEYDFYIDDRPYQKQAAEWARQYILNYDNSLAVYQQDLQMIANLIYFSYNRSYATLQAQSTALKTLESVWKGWQNIAQTRLDPSKNPPYQITDLEKMGTLENFWKLHDHHRETGTIYSQTVETIVDGDVFFATNARNAVEDMRKQARSVVAKAITDIREYVGQLFYSEKKSNKKSFAFLDYLWDYIPGFATTSFVSANNANDVLSEKSWAALMKIQEIGKRTWQIIEQERASFYLAFYNAIWAVMTKFNIEEKHKKIVFDTDGKLHVTHQTNSLPHPKTLICYPFEGIFRS